MSVRETYRIIECLNLSELDNLSKKDRADLEMLISAKVVILDEGYVARTILWEMFPEGTTTGQNIRNYIYGLVDMPYTPNPE